MSSFNTIPVVILAGGEGVRLGGLDKCLLSINNKTILDRLLEQLKGHQGPIFLNANGDLSRFKHYDIEKFHDLSNPPIGPIGGLYSGLCYLNTQTPAHSHFLSLPGDCPFLPSDLIEKLTQKAQTGNYDVVYAYAHGRDHFIVALWSTLVTQALEDYIAQGQRSLHGFISKLKSATVYFDECEYALLNINTLAQLDEAKSIAQKLESNT